MMAKTHRRDDATDARSIARRPVLPGSSAGRLGLFTVRSVGQRAVLMIAVFALMANIAYAEDRPVARAGAQKLYARDNLIAWCVVPFDGKKRGPTERVALLKQLGFRKYAYDWRDEHLPTFDEELGLLAKEGIALEALWFPASLNPAARTLLGLIEKHRVKTTLWVSMGDPAPGKEQAEKVAAAVRTLTPIVDEATRLGCRVALYNHGGWYGDPENQLAIIAALKRPNVGIVYNLHHAHDHLDRIPALLKSTLPHLYAVNLNGMVRQGDRVGKKILVLGEGDLDASLLKAILDSGYTGPIGIIGHTQHDVEQRLCDNLDGLDYVLKLLTGEKEPSRPKYRTTSPTVPAGTSGSGAVAPPRGRAKGFVVEGADAFREPPLTVECRVKLTGTGGYNIFVASDTKSSGRHWELFTMPQTGALTAYLPGYAPDHVRATAALKPGTWYDVAMVFEAERVRLFLDGEVVAEQAVKRNAKAAVAGGLAIGRLVEGGIGCDGELSHVHLRSGVQKLGGGAGANGKTAPEATDDTVGLWVFTDAEAKQIEDRSRFKRPAKADSVAAAPAGQGPIPTAGPHYTPADPSLKAVLLDRSESDAYCGLKLDTQGNLFVGARESLYVFEPSASGGYGPRQELYRFPADSIIIGIEWRGDDLYVLTDNALYLVPNGRLARSQLKPQRLLWGLPLDLHVSFHCLAWGPEGDLYLTHGDPLLNYGDFDRPDHSGHWTLFHKPAASAGAAGFTSSVTADGWQRTPFTGVGAVLRIRPDGTGLRVVSTGLRGPVGLAFDAAWNLFTNDNDHESRADLYAPCKLLHATPHIDFGWPRGWIASRTPQRADLIEPMIANLGRGVPCDIAFYGETYLPESVRGSLLMARWDRMRIYQYPLHAHGSSFRTEELPHLDGRNNARPTGVAVGRGGRVFGTALYLGGNVGTPRCVSDLFLITRQDDPDTLPFTPIDMTRRVVDELWTGLSSASWETRSRSHQELLRRGGEVLADATSRLERTAETDRAVTHLMWLAAASGRPAAALPILKLARQANPAVRRQALRVLAEFPTLAGAGERLAVGLSDTDDAARLAALTACFDDRLTVPWPAVTDLAASSDTYLRQTATRLLARRAPLVEITKLLQSRDPAHRLAGVLAAAGRLTERPSDFVPPESLPLQYTSKNAYFTLNFADAEKPVDLKTLGRCGSFTTREWWKGIAPDAEQQTLFQGLVTALDDASEAVALQSVYALSLLGDVRSEPLVAKTRGAVRARQFAGASAVVVADVWLAGPFADTPASGPAGAATAHPPESGPIDLTAEYAVGDARVTWRVQPLPATSSNAESDAGSRTATTAVPRESHYAHFRLQSGSRQDVLLEVDTSDTLRTWHNGRVVEAASHTGTQRVFLDLQPGGNEVLLRLSRSKQSPPLAFAVRVRANGSVTAQLPEKVRPLELSTGPEVVASEFLKLDWLVESKKGNAVEGRKLFGTLNCTKCHAVSPDQNVGGGPSLTDARRRFTVPHLVEAVLLPSRQVAEPFRQTTLLTRAGQTVSGLIVNETADRVELLLPDATRRSVLKSEIEERRLTTASPMPFGLVKQPDQLRDLLAYLLGNNPLPP